MDRDKDIGQKDITPQAERKRRIRLLVLRVYNSIESYNDIRESLILAQDERWRRA